MTVGRSRCFWLISNESDTWVLRTSFLNPPCMRDAPTLWCICCLQRTQDMLSSQANLWKGRNNWSLERSLGGIGEEKRNVTTHLGCGAPERSVKAENGAGQHLLWELEKWNTHILKIGILRDGSKETLVLNKLCCLKKRLKKRPELKVISVNRLQITRNVGYN